MNSPDDGNDDFNDSFRLPPHNNPYNINSRIMLTAITSLSIVIVVVVALHIYARCVLRRQARRRRAAFHVFGLTTVNQVHEPPKGLDPTVIAALPTFVVKQTDGQDHGTPIECAVCLSLLEEQETARLLPNCKHTFHAECIDVWLTSHSTCPICRTEAEPRQLQPEPREGPAGEAASAPPLDRALVFIEGSSESDGGAKLNGSSSRLHSFRRMLSRDRSFRRLQEDHSVDLERQ